MTEIGATTRELWHYRELFYFFVWRDVKVRYKQSVLGALWAILQPFLTMVVFTIFFHRVAKIPSDGVPYPIFSFSALLPWTYFSTSVNAAGTSLVNNRNLITKVYFPRATVPAASAMRGLVDLTIGSVILLLMMAYYGMRPDWEMLLWPILVIPMVMLAIGTGMLFSSVNVKYRDVQHILPFFIQLWMFVTPIIYPMSLIPERWHVLMSLNPASGLIEAFRSSVVPDRGIDWSHLGVSLAVTLVIFTFGAVYFQRTARNFADIV